MSDELDALSEAARNRGLKLVRSRVRSPTKRRFGKVGLTDKSGKPVFGMDEKGPAAKAEDVEHYLRNLGAKDWGASLDVAVLPRKRKAAAKAKREAANDSEPAPVPPPPPKQKAKAGKKPKPKPPPLPQVRDAKPSDAGRLSKLFSYLGHPIEEKALKKNLSALRKTGELPLVATLDKQVVGVCGVNRRVAVHRSAPLGRISVLVVAEEAQGRGIGRMLVEAAEAWFRKQGCTLVEVTSNDRRTQAHAFYRHMGYERTSIRFAKTL